MKYARKAYVYHGFRDLQTIFFSFLLHCLHISVYMGHSLSIKMFLVFGKLACAFGQVKTKMYLPESLFFQKFTCRGKRASTYVGACMAWSEIGGPYSAIYLTYLILRIHHNKVSQLRRE